MSQYELGYIPNAEPLTLFRKLEKGMLLNVDQRIMLVLSIKFTDIDKVKVDFFNLTDKQYQKNLEYSQEAIDNNFREFQGTITLTQ